MRVEKASTSTERVLPCASDATAEAKSRTTRSRLKRPSPGVAVA